MPLLTPPFDPAVGPLLTVTISYPASLWTASDTPAPTTAVTMLIDSAATLTCIAPTVATKLALPILGLRPLSSVTEQTEVNEYLADLYLPVAVPPYHLKDLRLIEFPMGNLSMGGLLGRDLLQRGLLQLNGPERTYTLAF